MKRDDAVATVLLVSRVLGDGPQQPLKAAEYWRLCAEHGPPSGLLGRSVDDLVSDGLPPEFAGRVVALVDRATAMAIEIDRLDQSGIVTITAYDEHYPQRFVDRLGHKAPPLLHAAGALGLLDTPGVGLVAGGDPTDGAVAAAGALAVEAVRLGLPVVTGGGRGFDESAMSAALAVGGSAVGVLGDSLVRTLRQPDIRRAALSGRSVMCTPYRPDASFNAASAAGRNKLVHALALASVVVATPDGSGDAWSGAIEALEQRFGKVAVWRAAGEGPGNAALGRRGALPLTSADGLEALLAGPDSEAVIPAEQRSLFG